MSKIIGIDNYRNKQVDYVQLSLNNTDYRVLLNVFEIDSIDEPNIYLKYKGDILKCYLGEGDIKSLIGNRLVRCTLIMDDYSDGWVMCDIKQVYK